MSIILKFFLHFTDDKEFNKKKKSLWKEFVHKNHFFLFFSHFFNKSRKLLCLYVKNIERKKKKNTKDNRKINEHIIKGFLLNSMMKMIRII